MDRGTKMTLSEYAQRLLSKIQKKNKTGPVVVDDLIEYTTFEETERIIAGIQELKLNGLISDKSIKHKGRFGTELVLTEGYVQHGTVKAKLTNPKLIAKKKVSK